MNKIHITLKVHEGESDRGCIEKLKKILARKSLDLTEKFSK